MGTMRKEDAEAFAKVWEQEIASGGTTGTVGIKLGISSRTVRRKREAAEQVLYHAMRSSRPHGSGTRSSV